MVQQFWRNHWPGYQPPSPGMCAVGVYEYKHYGCYKGFEGACKEKNVKPASTHWGNVFGTVCGEGTVSTPALGCQDQWTAQADTQLQQVGE